MSGLLGREMGKTRSDRMIYIAPFSVDSLLRHQCPGCWYHRQGHLLGQDGHSGHSRHPGQPRKAVTEFVSLGGCTHVLFLGQEQILLTHFCHIPLQSVTVLSLASSGCPSHSARKIRVLWKESVPLSVGAWGEKSKEWEGSFLLTLQSTERPG